MTSRGLRNNNPGNIRKSHTVYQGQSPRNLDPDFVSFLAPEWGLRAIARILLTYEAEGFRTVRQIVSRWAPPSENDTAAYVAAVAAGAGVTADQELDVRQPAVMVPLLRAIVRHENGAQPYPAEVFAKAVQLAGLATPEPPHPAGPHPAAA